MFEYLKKNWLGALGLLIGIVGILLSYYFYSVSIKSREPIFVTLSNVAIFSSPTELTSKYIKLVKRTDGKELSNNLYVQEVVLWNNGREAIKKAHLLKPLVLSFNEGVEIVDAFISEMRRPDIVKGSIQFNPGDRNLSLEFDILEKDDGIKIQIVYTALNSNEAILKGTIEGVPEIKKIEDLTKENLLLAVAKFFLYGIGIIGVLILILSIPDIIGWLNKKIFGKHHKKVNSIFDKFLMTTFGILFLLAIGFFIYERISELSKSSAIQSVPDLHNIKQER